MYKKLMLACMAVAAFGAFVIAPAASATTLTHEGKTLAVGTKVVATLKSGTNSVFTGAITVTCSKAKLTGEVTKNNDTEVEGKVLAANASFTGTSGTGTECTSTLFGAPVLVTVNSNLCMKITSTGGDVVTTTGCGANVVFTLNLTGNGPCKYSTASVKGTFSTNVTPAPVTVTKQESALIEGGAFCPSTGALDMTFELFTDGPNGEELGTGLTVS